MIKVSNAFLAAPTYLSKPYDLSQSISAQTTLNYITTYNVIGFVCFLSITANLYIYIFLGIT